MDCMYDCTPTVDSQFSTAWLPKVDDFVKELRRFFKCHRLSSERVDKQCRFAKMGYESGSLWKVVLCCYDEESAFGNECGLIIKTWLLRVWSCFRCCTGDLQCCSASQRRRTRRCAMRWPASADFPSPPAAPPHSCANCTRPPLSSLLTALGYPHFPSSIYCFSYFFKY